MLKPLNELSTCVYSFRNLINQSWILHFLLIFFEESHLSLVYKLVKINLNMGIIILEFLKLLRVVNIFFNFFQ